MTNALSVASVRSAARTITLYTSRALLIAATPLAPFAGYLAGFVLSEHAGQLNNSIQENSASTGTVLAPLGVAALAYALARAEITLRRPSPWQEDPEHSPVRSTLINANMASSLGFGFDAVASKLCSQIPVSTTQIVVSTVAPLVVGGLAGIFVYRTVKAPLGRHLDKVAQHVSPGPRF